jgi:hypothetical protein
MAGLKLDKFGGMLPAWDSRILPDGQADTSINAYLFSGALAGWRQPKLLRQLRNSAAQFVYRVPDRDTNDTAIRAEDSFWLEFLDPDTTVMHSPVVQDEFQRYYWASPSVVPRYNTYDRIVNEQHDWVLGVPASGCTPGVTVEGGGDTMVLGFQDLFPSSPGPQAIPGNHITFVPIIPTGSMLVQSISFAPTVTDDNTNFIGVVYSDVNGKPYELLGSGTPVRIDPAADTATSVFNNPVSVIANATYWLGVFTDTNYYLDAVDTTLRSVGYSATFSNDPPDPLNEGDIRTSLPTFRIWGNLLGASIFEARGYVYTWVTEYGEEGPPSAPVVVNGWSNATWTITLWQPMPENLGADYPAIDADGNPILDDGGNPVMLPAQRNITKTRVYRTISSQAGMGSYFFVAEIPVAQGVYVDTRSDQDVALEAQLVSLYWYAPPEDMAAILAFPNGISVGFRKNEVWFSEAYRPHAWPPGYVVTTEFPIVGIGIAGQSIIVCTQGMPYLINGVNPSAMALTKINLPEPCLHRGSIVATDTAVMYISQNGLIQINQSGSGSNTTEGWISRERWQALTPHYRVRAIKHASAYFAFGARESDQPIRIGFTVELSSEDRTSFTIWPQAGGHRLGFNQLTSPNDFDIDNVEVDPWTGIGLLVQNDGVWYYDFTDPSPVIVPYVWRSKTYQQQAKRNFAAMRIWFSVPDTTPPQVARDVSFPQLTLADNQYGIVRIYVDDALWTTREIRSSGELLRIFSGIKGEQWQFELEGRVVISNMQVATTVKELALV